MLKNHVENCPVKPIVLSSRVELEMRDENIKKLESENLELKNTINILKNTIENQKIVIAKYEIHINDLTGKIGMKQVTKMNFIQNYFAGIKPLDLSKERVDNIIDKLTIDDTCDKARGICRFLRENLLQDVYKRLVYICTDPSRRMFRYKDLDDEIRRDKRCENLFDKIFEPLVSKIDTLYRVKTRGKSYDEIIVGQGLYFTDKNGTFRTDLISCLSSSTLPKKMICKINDIVTETAQSDSDEDSDDGYFTIDEISKMSGE